MSSKQSEGDCHNNPSDYLGKSVQVESCEVRCMNIYQISRQFNERASIMSGEDLGGSTSKIHTFKPAVILS
jgi:hypothetical protein